MTDAIKNAIGSPEQTPADKPAARQKWFPTVYLAQRFDLHNESVRHMIRENRIAAKRFGRHWRISESEIARIESEGIGGAE